MQATIPRALSYLSERDQKAFRKKFREQQNDEQQVMHTFRELLVGGFITRLGYHPCYEPAIDGLTPDWGLGRDTARDGLADVVNFHVERAVEQQIGGTLEGGLIWSGTIHDQSKRFRGSLRGKAGKYDNLVAQKRVPYMVFVFEWMNATMEREEVAKWLFEAEGLFDEFPTLSAVYHMYERGDCRTDPAAGYRFDYHPNPKAIHPIKGLVSSCLPYGFQSADVI